ncbi:MAG: vWA domain-containing protein, partial [Boseongicola sp.]
MRLMSLIAILMILPFSAPAQERPKAILVLDGSGSMWGQIDGIAKITIAQDVVGELLGGLPVEQELGLTVYGHRQKGDCSDIETIVMPGADTRGAIADAVNAIKPKGKTPMTDAVVAAAEALRYTEERATVILVSDGIETCEPDPCAAARLLEETGVDFTAHVVGFDVADDPQALAQMQCLAEETGGTFRSAENAEELAAALVVVAEPPAPEPVTVRFRGIAGPVGPEIGEPLIWTIAGEAALVDSEAAPSLSFDLLPGQYQVEALWPE